MRQLLVGLALLLTLSAWAVDKFQPLNVKTGLWETTMTVTTSGQMPIPPEMRARLTPEQRAKLEERMQANSGAKTHTSTNRSCLTKEKLGRGTLFENETECTQTVVTSTSSKLELQVACEGPGIKSSGDLSIEALSTESAKGSGHMTMTGSGRTMSSSTTLNAKWISSSCGDVQ